jgi:hypothetical protein
MSDFLVSLNKKHNGEDLLRLIKKPYGNHVPEGCSFDFSWGSVAILQEHLANNKNIVTNNVAVLAWVGDLVIDLPDGFVKGLIKRLTQLQEWGQKDDVSVQNAELFGKLNGAFAMLYANATGFCIVTDPIGFTPVYVGSNRHNDAVSFGTHSDLVAGISNNSFTVDVTSAAEFLNLGNCTFPHTMHTSVKEIKPGRIHTIRITENNKITVRDFIYWLPPKEIRQGYDENALAEELRNALVSAVVERCNTGKVAVLLSGGLDSRLIMAAVPESVDCIGLTFCDEFNRETKVASRIAKCCNRRWQPLFRNSEFLANSMVDIVRFTGCEFEWVNAHAAGFFDEIREHGFGTLLSGFLFDSYLKACYAYDVSTVKRMGGLLPAKYERNPFDYADNLMDFWKQYLSREILEDLYGRRRQYYEKNRNQYHSSVECLYLYPFSQTCGGASWIAERRILPVRLVAADRPLLEFAFKCPIEMKLGNRIFSMAGRNIYGKLARIPSTNDGVRPGSAHLWRLVQRVVRKLQDRTMNSLEKLGKESKIQHSWHDYQRYWRESGKLDQLIQDYGVNLEKFDGVLFREDGLNLLKRKDIDWRYGFRLLQLAIWSEITENYKLS